MSTSDEENTENVESGDTAEVSASEAAPEAVQSSNETTDAPDAGTAEAASEEVTPAAVETVAETVEASHDDHSDSHGHQETHFPMDEEEGFERQLVSNYTHGGHEFDPPMARGLMIFTGSLTVIILFCAVGIMQMFKAEKNAMLTEQAAKIPKSLLKLRADNANKLTVAGKSADRNTVTVTIDEAKKNVAGNPALLTAFVNPPAPKGKEAK